jgi:TrmH family RNA methyltransferase
VVITSTRHPLVQTLRRLGEHPRPDPEHRMILDGPRLIEEALDAGITMESVLVAVRPAASGGAARARVEALEARLRAAGVRVYEGAPRVVQAAGRVVTSQGIVAVARRPREADESLLAAGDLLLFVADGIQDPGNLGTMLRTAVASGATLAAVTEGTADPFHPKVLRATMGAGFRIPILQLDGSRLRAAIAAHGVRVLVADAHGAIEYTEAPAAPPLAIVIGSETAGPDPAWTAIGTRVRIPLFGPVESLNAAVAAGVLLYDVARRRRAGSPEVH